MVKISLFVKSICNFKHFQRRNSQIRPFSKSKLKSNDYIKDYDIVILGGGTVGLSMASILAKDPITAILKVLVLEKSAVKNLNYKEDKSVDLRCYAINNPSRILFEKIGIWNSFQRKTPFYKMKLYDQLNQAMLTIDSNDKFSIDGNLGHIIEDKIIQGALMQNLQSKIIYTGSDKLIINNNNLNKITIETSQNKINTKLLIGADGLNSFTRNALGFPYYKKDYDEKAVVSIVKHDGQNNTCYQRFLNNGTIGFLPLHNGHSCIVWSTSTKNANELMSQNEKDFINGLNNAYRFETKQTNLKCLLPFFNRFGIKANEDNGFPPIVTGLASSKMAFPLSYAMVQKYTLNRVALIGDAAHSIHPMAGQGLNMGLKDVSILHENIKMSLINQNDIGHHSNLKDFEIKAIRNNKMKNYAVDLIHKAFSCDANPFPLLRNIGMATINRSNFLRRSMIDIAN